MFNHVKHITKSNDLDGSGPCVVGDAVHVTERFIARTLRGVVRRSQNGVIIADFAVQGTLAREILGDVHKVTARDGSELQLNMSVDAISFSAHADYPQTQAFLDTLAPPQSSSFTAQAGEMGRLKRALDAKAAADDKKMNVYTPKTVNPSRSFTRASASPNSLVFSPNGKSKRAIASGVLVQKDFGTMLIAAEDVNNYTKLRTSLVTQRQLVPSKVPISTLRFALEALFEGLHAVSTLVAEEAEEDEDGMRRRRRNRHRRRSRHRPRKRVRARKGSRQIRPKWRRARVRINSTCAERTG